MLVYNDRRLLGTQECIKVAFHLSSFSDYGLYIAARQIQPIVLLVHIPSIPSTTEFMDGSVQKSFARPTPTRTTEKLSSFDQV